jgi:hypothetical protein
VRELTAIDLRCKLSRLWPAFDVHSIDGNVSHSEVAGFDGLVGLLEGVLLPAFPIR